LNRRLVTIIATGLVIYGFIHIASFFWINRINLPFPFEHIFNVNLRNGGMEYEIGYDLNNSIAQDPYWLVWSFSLYSGIIILSILAIRKLIHKR